MSEMTELEARRVLLERLEGQLDQARASVLDLLTLMTWNESTSSHCACCGLMDFIHLPEAQLMPALADVSARETPLSVAPAPAAQPVTREPRHNHEVQYSASCPDCTWWC